MLACRALYSQFLTDDDDAAECNRLVQLATDSANRANTSELENWIVRIVFGGGGLKAKNPAKAIQKKLNEYTVAHKGNDKHVHPGLYKAAQGVVST